MKPNLADFPKWGNFKSDKDFLNAIQNWKVAFEKELQKRHALFKRLFEEKAMGLSTNDFMRFIEEILGEAI